MSTLPSAEDGDGLEAAFYNFCGPGHVPCLSWSWYPRVWVVRKGKPIEKPREEPRGKPRDTSVSEVLSWWKSTGKPLSAKERHIMFVLFGLRVAFFLLFFCESVWTVFKEKLEGKPKPCWGSPK